jgi:6-phosphogluconolactonase
VEDYFVFKELMPMNSRLADYNESLVVAPNQEVGASTLLDKLTELVIDGDSRLMCSVAIPGGESPRLFLSKAAQTVIARPTDWNRVHFFLTDERCVPPGHPDSNFLQGSELLFKPAGIGEQNTHRINCEDIPGEAAADYARDILCTLGQNPKLDLAILGMGSDGHTASLFPDTDLRVEQSGTVGWCFVPRLKSWRVTLTADFLRSSGSMVVIAWGVGKAEAVRQALSGDSSPQQLPVLGLRPHRGHLTWIIDEQAASLL